MSEMSLPFTDAAVVYHLRPRAPGTHLFEVSCKIRDPDPAGQIVSLPAWIPGSYLIRDFARHVVSLEATCNGVPVPLRKSDKSTWRAAPADGELLLRAEIYANDLSVRGAHLDAAGGIRQRLQRVSARSRTRVRALRREPEPGRRCAMAAWQVATTLTRLTGTTWEYGAFEAADYEELIDHPVLMGPAHRGGIRGLRHAARDRARRPSRRGYRPAQRPISASCAPGRSVSSESRRPWRVISSWCA